MYAANVRQLSHSLIISYERGYKIRVFRSSKCGKYAPPYDKKGHIQYTRYRYDGLYKISDYYKVQDFFVFILFQYGDHNKQFLYDSSEDDCIGFEGHHGALILLKMLNCQKIERQMLGI